MPEKLSQESFEEFVFIVSEIISIKFTMECNTYEQAEFLAGKYQQQLKDVFDTSCLGKDLTLQKVWCNHIGPELTKIMNIKV